ncbi:MAG: preprotein translocase subunit SecD [Moorella sp. (in: firmicutes)]|uniref:Protein translocase subunit SecD n=1 Tax=Neomoorella thermoacetica TaxID=1525 RepID=A0A1J5NR90_NEOTH|nr:preprotein translocase subunit SecD [Moorella sp. (in: firmicutes)]OIQ61266.1 protein translocase subunit SecD [Moorella thermoacetica]
MAGGKGAGGFLKLAVVLIAILALGIGAFKPLMRVMKLGLDLKGGVHVVAQAQSTPDHAVTPDDMAALERVMRDRVDQLGIAEPLIQREGNDRLIIELAGVNNPEEAIKMIGKTAQLEFKTSDGQVVVSGKDLKDAKAIIDQQTQEPQITLQFNAEGTKKFADATKKLASSYPYGDPRRAIGIYLDQQLLTNPQVKEAIPNGQAIISGGFANFNEAANLAALLRGGALPVPVQLIEHRIVGPTLGADSLAKSKNAIIVSIVLIALFMLVMYRLPGVVAIFSLVIYALIILTVLWLLKATMTLPGIAGILLSVGMAVDANILIYERLREELRNGKTLRAAIDAGFRHAFVTIVDTNSNSILAAVVLYYLGSGAVRGFAINLGLGVLASFFTAVTLTRFLLHLIAEVPWFQNYWFYGVKGPDQQLQTVRGGA